MVCDIHYLRFRVHPNVLQVVKDGGSECCGRHIGLTKSEIVAGKSSFTNTIVLPSTGDLTIPTMCLSCCNGDVDVKRILPRRAIHSAFCCLLTKKAYLYYFITL